MTTVILVISVMLSVSALADDPAAGDVSGAIEQTWTAAAAQIKTIVNNVVFPAIFFFVKLGTAYFDYRKHGQFEWAPPAILLACLIFTLTAPAYIWSIIGM